jgi:cytochrome c peroxidase
VIMKRSVARLIAMLAASLVSSSRLHGGEVAHPPRALGGRTITVPADNPMTPGKIKLGEQLFFDRRLSKTKTHSCETCHLPEKGWTDGLKLSTRSDGTLNTRHTPTLYEAAYCPELSWDGRARGLETQILAVWKGQMGADPEAMARDLAAIPGYEVAFEREMGGPPTGDRIVKALATFVRTIHAEDTPYDRLAPDHQALEKSDVGKGLKVFSGEAARCTDCHQPPLFTDTLFHNIGIGSDRAKPDLGRGQFLADEAAKTNAPASAEAAEMEGAFKTPTLRGIAQSAPYFHDGRAPTLERAIDLMLDGGIGNPHCDPKLQPAKITAKERAQLLAFLKSLTPETRRYPRPTLPVAPAASPDGFRPGRGPK